MKSQRVVVNMIQFSTEQFNCSVEGSGVCRPFKKLEGRIRLRTTFVNKHHSGPDVVEL